MENESLRSLAAGFGRSFGHNPAAQGSAPQPISPPISPPIAPSIAPDLAATQPLAAPPSTASTTSTTAPSEHPQISHPATETTTETDTTANPNPAPDPADRAEADYEDGFGPPPDYTQGEYRWVAVRRRPRYDGWNEEKQRRFIEVLADTGIVALAAKAVGMTRESAYRLRRSEHAVGFANAWETARAQAGALIEDITFERAIEGIEHNVFDENGEIVCTKRVYNDRLLMFLLRNLKPERYGTERQAARAARLAPASLHDATIVEGKTLEAATPEPSPPEPSPVPSPLPTCEQGSAAHDALPQEAAPPQTLRVQPVSPQPVSPQAVSPQSAELQPVQPQAVQPQPIQPQPLTFDAALRALEPQPPAPIEQWIGTEKMQDEMELADVLDGEIPDFFMERRLPKSPEDLEAEARAAQFMRGKALWENKDGKGSKNMNRKDWRDMCLYFDPAQRYEKSKKRYR